MMKGAEDRQVNVQTRFSWPRSQFPTLEEEIMMKGAVDREQRAMSM